MLRMNPLRGAVGVVFVFPDRDAGFDFVDDEAAGGEGGISMRGGDADMDGDVADGEQTDAMFGDDAAHRELGQGLVDDGLALARGELGVGFVAQFGHGAAGVMVAHDAVEGDNAAAVRVFEFATAGSDVDGCIAQTEMRA